MPSSPRRARDARKRPRSLADLRYAAEVAAAYDALAPTYDDCVRREQWMREVLWRRYRRLFRAPDRVLDVGCGTGADVLRLASWGVRVTGLDLSAQMVAELEAAAAREGLNGLVRARVGDAADLASWPGDYFHGVISAFAGLATVRDLGGFAADAARLLLPGGRLLAHMAAPGDVWERRRFARERGPDAAWREHHRRHRSHLVAGRPLSYRVVSAHEAYYRYFQPHFRLRRRYGLGFLLPEERMERLPAAAAREVGRVESWLGRLRPFLQRSRFFVLELEPRERSGG